MQTFQIYIDIYIIRLLHKVTKYIFNGAVLLIMFLWISISFINEITQKKHQNEINPFMYQKY